MVLATTSTTLGGSTGTVTTGVLRCYWGRKYRYCDDSSEIIRRFVSPNGWTESKPGVSL